MSLPPTLLQRLASRGLFAKKCKVIQCFIKQFYRNIHKTRAKFVCLL